MLFAMPPNNLITANRQMMHGCKWNIQIRCPEVDCQHEGAARVMTFQPRDNIFECSTSNRASSVLSYDQLRASTKSIFTCFTENSLCVTV